MENPETGLVECFTEENKTSVVLAVGETFPVERQDIGTTITRVSAHEFKVISQAKKHKLQCCGLEII